MKNEREMDKMKKRTKILIIVGVIVLIMIAGILYLVALDEKQNELLTEELAKIEEYAQTGDMDNEELQAILNRTVTTGDYAKIETACKQYLTDILDKQEKIKQILEDEKLTKILSVENYQVDGPEFVSTKEYITTTRTNLNQYTEELTQLISEEKILSYAENQGMDSTDIEIYRQELTDQINEEELKNELDGSIGEITKILDTAEKIIDFLMQNKSHWTVEGENIIFENQQLSDQYNTLIAEL